MLIERRNHAGRTMVEQATHERRMVEWERQEAHRRAIAQRFKDADESARVWGEW